MKKQSPMESDPLEAGLKELELFSDERYTLLVKYIEEIERFNTAYGLVKVKDRKELILKHILDSLAPIKFLLSVLDDLQVSAPRRIADVGSGAGLPGIPLAICMSDAEFTLIERSGRRAGFLHNTIAALGLSNVVVEEVEAEKAAPGRFDSIVFRALKPLNSEPNCKLLELLLSLLKEGGFLAAYKGRRETVEEEMAGFPGTPWELHPIKVPFLNDERHLVVIKV
ncbi:MAG: 16S rRNA (guanine(527)-N(7))-methyltransferase RsmG [Treponema sp.]|nr:16S rRNA (guanine(527)-N(7))-methyltransferase RsmG [Treponema sp.]